MVVVPERGGVLLERIVADAGFAGDEPVFGVAVVLRAGLGAVKWVTVRTSGTSWPQPWREWSMGRKCFGGEVVDPLDLRGARRCGLR